MNDLELKNNLLEKVETTFLKTIERFSLLSKGDRVLIALSGGADSVLLAYLLKKYKDNSQVSLFACHLNHSLRGNESLRDEVFSRNLARLLGIDFVSKTVDVKSFARGKKLSIEEAARKVRYEFFEEVMREKNLNKLAIAHNLDDLFETMLYRLLKGTGVSGLIGIPVKRFFYNTSTEIIRPLLFITKESIVSYLKFNNIDFVFDSSNEDIKFSRNFLRKNIVPLFEKRFPFFKERIVSLYNILWEEENFWLAELSKYDKFVVKESGDFKILKEFFKLDISLPLKRRMIRNVINNKMGINAYLSFDTVDKIIFSLKDEGSRVLYFSKKIKIYSNYGDLVFSLPDENQKDENTILLCEKRFAFNGFEFQFDILSFEEVKNLNFKSTPVCLYFDATGSLKFYLRFYQNGDRIYIDQNKTKKLSDIFVDCKVPRFKRKNTIVVFDENNSIVGFILPFVLSRVSKLFYVNENTKKVGMLKICG